MSFALPLLGRLLHSAAPCSVIQPLLLTAAPCSVGLTTLVRANMLLAAALAEEEKAEEEVGAGRQLHGVDFGSSHACAQLLAICPEPPPSNPLPCAMPWLRPPCLLPRPPILFPPLPACQGREPVTPEFLVADLMSACVRGSYNACLDLATQVRWCAAAVGVGQAQ